MQRRTLLLGIGAALLSPAGMVGASGLQFPNGRWDPQAEVFHWGKINVDPFRAQPLKTALDLFNISPAEQRVIIRAIERRPGAYTTPTNGVQQIREGHFYGAMVSGGVKSRKAWAVPNVKPAPDASWNSTDISVWTVPVGNKRFVVGRPHGCSNWVILPGTNGDFHCPKPV